MSAPSTIIEKNTILFLFNNRCNLVLRKGKTLPLYHGISEGPLMKGTEPNPRIPEGFHEVPCGSTENHKCQINQLER